MNPPNHSHLIQPYLFFGGKCEEAIEFYKQSLGAEVDMLIRYNESPEQPPDGMLAPGFEEKVMHASFRIGKSTVMASDGCGEPEENRPLFGGFCLSISVPDEASCDRAFDALKEGGEINMPLAKTFWSPRFGMVTDKFGIGWMIGLEP